MPDIKRHVGKIKNTGQKCVVVFRVMPESREHGVPADRDNALVVQSDQLPDMYHDNLMDVIQSREAQQTVDLWRVLHRRSFGDGANMINALHQKNFLKKVPVDNIDLYPMPNQSIPLRQANNQIDGTRDAVNERHHLQAGDVTEEQPAPTAENITEQYSNAEPPAPDLPPQQPQPGMSAAEAGRQAAQQQASAAQAQGPGGADAEAQAANLIAQAEMMEQDAQQKREQAYSLNPSLRGKRAVHGAYENTKRGFRESDERARQRRFDQADEEALSENTTTTNKKKTTKKKSTKKKASKKKSSAKKKEETN